MNKRCKLIAVGGLIALALLNATTSAQRAPRPTITTPALTITSEPNAIVWLDEIRRGTTDASGKLAIANVTSTRHTLRVRANGFKEVTVPLLPGKRTALVKLVRSTDPAGRGVQPEAHVGLARLYEENGQQEEAIAEYQKAIAQLSDSEPVIYQLMGAAYEKQQKYKEALDSYEKYLALAPNGSLAPALRSIIEQLRRDAAGQEIIP